MHACIVSECVCVCDQTRMRLVHHRLFLWFRKQCLYLLCMFSYSLLLYRIYSSKTLFLVESRGSYFSLSVRWMSSRPVLVVVVRVRLLRGPPVGAWLQSMGQVPPCPNISTCICPNFFFYIHHTRTFVFACRQLAVSLFRSGTHTIPSRHLQAVYIRTEMCCGLFSPHARCSLARL